MPPLRCKATSAGGMGGGVGGTAAARAVVTGPENLAGGGTEAGGSLATWPTSSSTFLSLFLPAIS